MAIIGKIRKRSGLIIGLIGLSLLAFILTDALNRNPFSKNQKAVVGEIGGNKIEYTDYDKKVTDMETAYGKNTEMQLTPQLRDMIRDRIWQDYVDEYVIKKEYKKLHIDISPEELTYVEFQAPEAHSVLSSQFTDRQTGQVAPQYVNPGNGKLDLGKVLTLRQSFEEGSENEQQWIEGIDKPIIAELENRKYQTYIRKSVYVNSLEAKEDFAANNQNIKAQFVGLNYTTIPDTAVVPTDAEMQEYINKHTEDFQQEASRKIEYVVFDLLPSAEDTATAQKWADDQVEKFRKTNNDSLYVSNNGGQYDTVFKPHGSFPEEIEDSLFAASKGSVLGPIYKDGQYSLYKVLNTMDDSVYYYRASHILIKPEGNTKEDTAKARKKAADLLAEIKKGKDWNEAATQNSQDFSNASKGGDLGWFGKNTGFVKEFVDAAAVTPKGQYTIATTQFGVHIIKMTHEKTNKKIQVGVIKRDVEPGSKTVNEINQRAMNFAGMSQNEADFNANIEKDKLPKRVADDVHEEQAELPGLPDARKLVVWMFADERKVGDVSEAIDVSNSSKLVVARLAAIREKGTSKVEDVRDKVEPLVKKEKKALKLKAQIEEAMKSSKNMLDLAIALKTIVNDLPSQNFATANVSFLGSDNRILGYLFGIEPKKMSAPIKGENGVYVLWVENKEEPKYPEKLDDIKNKLKTDQLNKTDYSVQQALKKSADIKDYRYRFF